MSEDVHRPARLGRGVPAGRGLHRLRRHQRARLRRGPHPARLHARARATPRRSPARTAGTSATRTTRSSERFEFAMEVTRIEDRPRPTKPYSDAQWQALLACGDEVERALAQQRRAPDDGRRADLRGDGRSRRRRVEHRRGRPDQAQVRRRAAAPAAAALRARAACCTTARASGTRASRCRAGPTPATSARTASRSGRTPRCSPQDDAPPGHGTPQAHALITRAVPSGSASTRASRSRRSRTSSTTCGASAACPRTSIRSTRKLEDETSARGCAACSSTGCATSSASRCRCARAYDDGAAALRERQVVPARRAHVPDPGRLADGLSPAARLAAVGGRRAIATQIYRARPDGAARRAAARASSCAQRAPAPLGAGAPRSCRAGPAAVRGQSTPGVVRTALCVEPRDGILHVFMPPFAELEEYLDAGRRARGHAPPSSACRCSSRATTRRATTALQRLQVTPDPGVIEVNIHPARSLARARRQHDRALRGGARLPADERQVHGRRPPHRHRRRQPHHARRPAPEDSPFLRRPDLLRSLDQLLAQPPVALVPVLGHVRRSDQPGAAHRRGAPRQPVRARHRVRGRWPRTQRRAAAVARRPRCSATCSSTSPATPTAPSCASTSSTAPTRRAAARAWSSCAPSRCRPTAQMSCAAQLLVRALLACVLEASRTSARSCAGARRLRRSLHAAALRRAGLRATCSRDLQPRGLRARPRLVRAAVRVPLPAARHASRVDGLELELRQAIEPWHVLGEQPARRRHGALRRLVGRARAGAGAQHDRPAPRGRLQRPARAAASDRHARASTWPACATAPGSRRPRCTRPSACTRRSCSTCSTSWSERSLGGCTYHVAHPGGRSHDTFPRNALEAESRRDARFFPFGHSPGTAAAAAARAQRGAAADARPAQELASGLAVERSAHLRRRAGA